MIFLIFMIILLGFYIQDVMKILLEMANFNPRMPKGGI